MKDVIEFYTHLANCFDENGFIKEAEDLTEKAIKTAQIRNAPVSPLLPEFEQLINDDAKKAADIVLKGMKGEIPKESVKRELESMMKKQESFKFNNNITQNDENILLNKMIKKIPQKQKVQTPVFKSTEDAEKFYNQKHTFNTPQEAQKFQADKARFLKSRGGK